VVLLSEKFVHPRPLDLKTGFIGGVYLPSSYAFVPTPCVVKYDNCGQITPTMITGFEIQRSGDGTNFHSYHYSPQCHPYADDGLHGVYYYYYRVRAAGTEGNSG